MSSYQIELEKDGLGNNPFKEVVITFGLLATLLILVVQETQVPKGEDELVIDASRANQENIEAKLCKKGL